MPLNNVTLRQLRTFSAIARTGSMTGAAEAMRVTPPAVTSQMQLLQGQVGLSLIDRTAGGIILTAAGRELLLAVERIERILADCGEQLAAQARSDIGSVSVGLISTAKYVVPRALAVFRRRHPGIEMRLAVGNREAIIDGLQAYDLDVAVMGRPPDGLDVDADLIGPNPLVIVAAPDHPLARKRRIQPATLQTATFLGREPGSGTGMAMQRFFAAHGLEPRIAMQIDSNETLKQAVIAGLGLAFISAHTIETDLKVGQLAVLDIVGLPILREWFLVHMRERRLAPAAATLRSFILDELGRYLAPERVRASRASPGRPTRSHR